MDDRAIALGALFILVLLAVYFWRLIALLGVAGLAVVILAGVPHGCADDPSNCFKQVARTVVNDGWNILDAILGGFKIGKGSGTDSGTQGRYAGASAGAVEIRIVSYPSRPVPCAHPENYVHVEVRKLSGPPVDAVLIAADWRQTRTTLRQILPVRGFSAGGGNQEIVGHFRGDRPRDARFSLVSGGHGLRGRVTRQLSFSILAVHGARTAFDLGTATRTIEVECFL